MPNYVKVNVKAAPKVIEAMVNGDHIDFNKILPFPGPHDEWTGISLSAEYLAYAMLDHKSTVSSTLLRQMENDSIAQSKRSIESGDFREEDMADAKLMVENFKACGFLHSMNWARSMWGTKWNAMRSEHDIEEGTATFETAWSVPTPLILKLSTMFPEERIEVEFADENMGSNCGRFVAINGTMPDEFNERPGADQVHDDSESWLRFAGRVWGYDDAEIEQMVAEYLEDV